MGKTSQQWWYVNGTRRTQLNSRSQSHARPLRLWSAATALHSGWIRPAARLLSRCLLPLSPLQPSLLRAALPLLRDRRLQTWARLFGNTVHLVRYHGRHSESLAPNAQDFLVRHDGGSPANQNTGWLPVHATFASSGADLQPLPGERQAASASSIFSNNSTSMVSFRVFLTTTREVLEVLNRLAPHRAKDVGSQRKILDRRLVVLYRHLTRRFAGSRRKGSGAARRIAQPKFTMDSRYLVWCQPQVPSFASDSGRP